MNSYRAYRLPLPSGGIVRVRKATPQLLLARGLLLLPLVAVAASVTASADEHGNARNEYLQALNDICRACLLDPEIEIEALTLQDRMTLQQWASVPIVAPAWEEPDSIAWTAADFAPLVSSPTAALFVDAVCKRYQTRPSALLGINDLALAVDLDCAIAYRGCSSDANQGGSSGEVDAEDAWGNIHRVPAAALFMPEAGMKVVHMDTYARRMEKLGIKEMSLSVGGGLNAGLGPMGRMDA